MRRLLALLALSVVAATACSDDPQPAAADDRSGGTETTVAPADLPPEGRGEVTDGEDGTRVVTSTWGTVEVPAAPERIVSVLGYVDLESMLALGVVPVGAGTQGGTLGSGFAPHLDGRLDGVEALPWADGAPVEAIAALQPDLIFAPDADSAELLAEIAPTVPAGTAHAPDWKEDLRYIAAVLGRSAEAEALLDGYEADAADLAERLAPVADGRTVASPQVAFDHAQVYVDGVEAFSSVVLTELGLDLAPVVTEATEVPIEISFERLSDLDADILFWQVRQRDEDGSRDTDGLQVAVGSPLYPQLPAVVGGTVFEVENRPWYFPTILAARQVLADVEEALL